VNHNSSIEQSVTRALAPAAPELPAMPPTGRISAVVADVGLMLGGVSEPAYCAIAWRWARDRAALVALTRHLRLATVRLAQLRGWPTRMRGLPYLDRLVWLALCEEHHWWAIRQTRAWPLLIGMDADLWEHRVAEKYNEVRRQLDSWCAEARACAVARLDDR